MCVFLPQGQHRMYCIQTDLKEITIDMNVDISTAQVSVLMGSV